MSLNVCFISWEVVTTLKTDAKSHSSPQPPVLSSGPGMIERLLYIVLMIEVMVKEVIQLCSLYTENRFSKKARQAYELLCCERVRLVITDFI